MAKISITGTKEDDIINAALFGYIDPKTGINKNVDLVIKSGKGNDAITASAGNDTINAGEGNDLITAGKGNDKLTGGKGGDVFVFSSGDGVDTITDANNLDTIKITDVDKDDLRFGKNGNHLEIYYDDTFDETNKIIVQNYFKKTAAKRPDIEADGEIVTDIKYSLTGNKTITGTKGNDDIIGSSSNDTIKAVGGINTVEARGGNDKLYGGTTANSKTTFIFNVGDGQDVVNSGKGEDTLRFEGVGLSGISFTQGTKSNNKDLIIKYSENDQVTVKNYYTVDKKGNITGINSKNSVKHIVAEDGNIFFGIQAQNEFVLDGGNDLICNSNNTDIIKIDSYNDIKYFKDVNSNDLTVTYSTNIACYGDSITEGGSPGGSWTKGLQALLGSDITVSNCGKSGQCSGAIAFRQGGVKIFVNEDFTIPEITTPVTLTITSTSKMVNLIGNSPKFSVTINGISGILAHTPGGRNGEVDTVTFTRNKAGESISVSAGTEFISDQATHQDETVILWTGRNDMAFSWPYQVSGPIDNYARMIDNLSSETKRFLIISTLTTTGETTGQDWHTKVLSINSQLAELYPDNFIDIRDYLVNQCIYDAGIEPTEEDLEKMAGDTIPPSLMYDGVHPNAIAKEYIAKYLYEEIEKRGWGVNTVTIKDYFDNPNSVQTILNGTQEINIPDGQIIIQNPDGLAEIKGTDYNDIITSGNDNNTLYGGKGNDTYIIESNLSDSDIIFDEQGGNDIISLTKVNKADLVLRFDLQIDSDGNIIDNLSKNMYITSSSDFGNDEKGIKVTDQFVGKNSIETIETADNYTLTTNEINQLRENVAGWLHTNGFESVQQILDSGVESNINNLIAQFQTANWQQA